MIAIIAWLLTGVIMLLLTSEARTNSRGALHGYTNGSSMDINLAAHRVGKSLRSHRVLLSAGLERRLAGSAANSRQSQGVPGIFGQLSRRYPGCHSGAQSSDYGREGCDQRGDGWLPPQLYACDRRGN